MIDATDLLTELRHRGYTLSVKGETLVVTPASRLTADERADITAHKIALLHCLADERNAAHAAELEELARTLPPSWEDLQATWGKVDAAFAELEAYNANVIAANKKHPKRQK